MKNTISALFLSFFILQISCQAQFDMQSAPWTPFISPTNQSINYAVIPCLQKLHANNGVTTVWLGGNMAQWTSMTTTERFTLFSEWVKANRLSPNKLKLLPQVGNSCLESACELTRATTAAFKNDIAGLALIGPAYLDRPNTVQLLVDWIKKIDDCQDGNPKVPIYYYHIPGNTNIYFKMRDIITAAQAVGINFGGVKFVDDDVLDFYDSSKLLGPSGTMFWAPNPKLRALPFGARAFVLAENWYAPYIKKIAENFIANNVSEALNWELKLRQVGNAVGLGSGRAVDGMIDPDCENGPPRLPQSDISPAQREAEFNALTDIGFFDFIKENWPTSPKENPKIMSDTK